MLAGTVITANRNNKYMFMTLILSQITDVKLMKEEFVLYRSKCENNVALPVNSVTNNVTNNGASKLSFVKQVGIKRDFAG